MPGLDEAADVFTRSIGGGGANKQDDEPSTMMVEDLFPTRDKEQDVSAGGDDLPDEDAAPERPRRARRQVAETDDEPEDPEEKLLYGEDPPNPKEGEEEDDEEEDDDPDEEEDDEPVAIDPDLEVDIIVDGKPEKVTIKEALEGYTRTETFHKRLNDLNEVKKVMRTEAGTLLEHRKQAVGMLNELEADIQALMPPEPDWDKLFAESPANARALQKGYEDLQGRIDKVRNARKEQQSRIAAEEQTNVKTYAADEMEKFTGLQENRRWQSNPELMKKDLAAMVRTARSVGFTDAEISGTLDSRMLATLLRASKYDRISANKPKPRVETGKKTTRPGTGNGAPNTQRTVQRGLGRAQQRLQKTGSLEAAGDVFAQIISKPRNRR